MEKLLILFIYSVIYFVETILQNHRHNSIIIHFVNHFLLVPNSINSLPITPLLLTITPLLLPTLSLPFL